MPVAEPSQTKRNRAKSLIGRSVNNAMNGSIDGCVDGLATYLPDEQLSINAHLKEILLATSSQ